MTTLLRTVGIVLLCSICFFPLLRFAAPVATGNSLGFFISLSICHLIVMASLGWYLKKTANNHFPFQESLNRSGSFLFLSGLFFVIAFSMGAPPRDANEWISHSSDEVLRTASLLIAVTLTGIGLYFFSRIVFDKFSKITGILYAIIVLAATTISLYDFYWGLVIIPRDIQAWLDAGKNPGDFFSAYDLKNNLRAAGRIFIYFSTIATLLVGWKLNIVKGWVAVILTLLCVFFMQEIVTTLIVAPNLINTKIGMVPAIALAPLYFLGVYWISTYGFARTKTNVEMNELAGSTTDR